MGELSKIEWTDNTFNPWIGCQHISPGCDHCYAEAQNKFRKWNGGEWGPHAPRKRTSEPYWRQPLKWNDAAKSDGVRIRIFCASLADWLDNQAPRSWREDLADLITETPYLDWLLLTKRIENYSKLAPWQPSKIPKNVWLGVTCEDQQHYDRRWNILSRLPAVVRFISYEPALGSLEIGSKGNAGLPDWIICGGESGPAARYMKPRWARKLLEQCQAKNVAFFMKQMTQKQVIPVNLLVREFPHSHKRLAAA